MTTFYNESFKLLPILKNDTTLRIVIFNDYLMQSEFSQELI